MAPARASGCTGVVLHMIDELWEFLWVAAHAFFQRIPLIDGQNLFLPRGTGPSILILGGLAMLGVSLYASLKIPHRAPASASPDAPGGGVDERQGSRAHRFSLPMDSEPTPPYVRRVLDAAHDEGLETPRRVTAPSGRNGVAFSKCPSYRFATDEHRGCERVRKILAEGVTDDPGKDVAIGACHPWEERACVFEIVEEGSP